MNTNDLMNAVLKHESIIITLEKSKVTTVKSRLSNLRSRQQARLEEFADDRRLDYLVLDLSPEQIQDGMDPNKYCRLRVSLVSRTMPIKGIVGYAVAEDF